MSRTMPSTVLEIVWTTTTVYPPEPTATVSLPEANAPTETVTAVQADTTPNSLGIIGQGPFNNSWQADSGPALWTIFGILMAVALFLLALWLWKRYRPKSFTTTMQNAKPLGRFEKSWPKMKTVSTKDVESGKVNEKAFKQNLKHGEFENVDLSDPAEQDPKTPAKC